MSSIRIRHKKLPFTILPCGSGSLLLKANDEAPHGLTIFDQEMDNATSTVARMNMILHNNATAKSNMA
ncbi:N-6 DNA methylase [Nitrosomonas sp. sh817]|uniref:N-6 DNA methylase n=1 Tax=Nitrosomonas sp. sh817 TaxID=3070658 RepID=UPI0027DB05BE|nr:N-6 DNA methylase [Nitrosomonas sp. sh817]WMJ07627.1 N-6 DNA methylase [Nitrosomonas sp. sh817]